MRFMKRVFDFYLDASIHVALSVSSLYFLTVWFLEIDFNGYLLGCIGLSTIVGYNFIKYGVEATKYVIVEKKYHKLIQVFSFLCFIPLLYCLWQLQARIWWALIILTLLSGVYALPVLPKTKNLRSLGVLKIFIVALVWTGFTVLLPLIDQHIALSWDHGIFAVQRFLLVLALILPFEIRDMAYDPPEMKTVPQRLGIAKTKIFGYGLMLAFFTLTFFKDNIHASETTARFVVMGVVIFLLNRTTKVQPRYFASFWVEAIPVFWFLLIYLLKSVD